MCHSFYNDAAVLERSVVQVTSNVAYDPNGTALPGGLYDPRMGICERGQVVCPTCAGNDRECPGHSGHIALAVPVFHPLLVPDIVSVLLSKCMNCHRLRRSKERYIATATAKFVLLYQDRIAEYQALDTSIGSALYELDKKSAQAGESVEAILRPILEQDEDEIPKRLPDSSYHRQEHIQLSKEVLSYLKKAGPCQFCGAYSPKVRHDAHNKVFRAPLSKKNVRLNQGEGIRDMDSSQVDEDGGYNSDDTDRNVVSDDDEDEEDAANKSQRDQYFPTTDIEAHLRRLWDAQPFISYCLWGDVSKYILRVIPVPPSRFRPALKVNGSHVQHTQTNELSKILTLNTRIEQIVANEPKANIYTLCMDVQTAFNSYLDSDKNPQKTVNMPVGVRQLLEKKEGLFRKNMMGKRVNYACRSVISPDPYIGTSEIGLPVYFCQTLTYAVPVTEFNLQHLRRLVERGPDRYPAARWVDIMGRRIDLSRMDEHERKGVAARLMVGKDAVVGRQLRDGDYVLMNRQPTLHKPGIMAHRVRVLFDPTQKTIRMHYANCNTYNADFDGDEMNCHFPQNELGRAEAKYLAQTDLQYIVPTDGSPLRGLIQDHVVGGVKMTQKDTFFEKWEYQQLLFLGISGLSGLELIDPSGQIESMPPAIMKPRELWTGKQVVSTLLLHLRKGKGHLPGLSAERKAKTPGDAFGEENDEHLVLIRDGELLRGVLDKAAFGSTDFSMVHATYEAYGPGKASMLLNALGRLFTGYIQHYSGHSCRMEDLVLTDGADVERRKLVQRAYNAGCRAAKAWADSEGGKMPIKTNPDQEGLSELKPVEKATTAAKIQALLSGSDGNENFAALDGFMQSQLNPLASDIVKQCLPHGLAVPFPLNTFGVMTTTGAKGSIVNQSQVSCALGQQALEGRRVPRLSSGRTLPSFAPYDPHPRSDGFVLDRFLTGIRPQEYYFHCMAGREGLVDTAVKTSRSGYLQRCLVKHLEELKVAYDYSVRNSEGGVIQFLYGEDGLDPTKATYLDCSENSFEFFARNSKALRHQYSELPCSTVSIAANDSKRHEKVKNATSTNLKKGDTVLARRLRFGSRWERGALCQGWKLAEVTKVEASTIDLRYSEDDHEERHVPLEIEVSDTTSRPRVKYMSTVNPCVLDPVLSSSRDDHRLGSSGACVSERVALAAFKAMKDKESSVRAAIKACGLSSAEYSALVGAKYSSSLCAPGEAVGCIAAQSVGEPSTQMTLNTFHLAGSGANVTLGIPRLREIIMAASKTPKTPTMSVPLREWVSEKQSQRIANAFTKLNVIDLLAGERGIVVTERLEEDSPGVWLRAYYVTLRLHHAERIHKAFGLTIQDVARVVAAKFVPALSLLMKKEIRQTSGDKSEIRGTSNQAIFEEKEIEKIGDGPDVVPPSDDDDGGEGDVDDDSVNEEDGLAFANKQNAADDDEESQSDTDSEGGGLNHEIEGNGPIEFEHKLNESSSTTISKAQNSISLQALKVEPDVKPLLMVDLVERAASKVAVRSKKGIDQAFINDESGRGRCLQTAGSNLHELWKLEQAAHEKLMSNDVWAMRCSYGVEAARGTILEQIRAVFGVYGIEVDNRHLSLIGTQRTCLLVVICLTLALQLII